MPKYLSLLGVYIIFFLIKLEDYFQFEPGWYRQGDARPVAKRYYYGICCILKAKPELLKYLKKCCHCHILFFTDPRNAARDDVRCPFGCRVAISKEKGAIRDATHRRSKKGKRSKKKRNKRRSEKGPRPGQPIKKRENRSDDTPQEGAPRPHEPAQEGVAGPGKPTQDGTPQPDGLVQENGPVTGGHVKRNATPPDGPVQEEVTRPDEPAQEELAQEKGRRIDKPVNEEITRLDKPVQEAARQPDAPAQKKGGAVGEPSDEEVSRPDKPAQAGLAQINGSAEKKGPRDKKISKRCEPNRSNLIYIQRIIRLVDKRRVGLDLVDELILIVRQRGMDFHDNWKYPFTRAP